MSDDVPETLARSDVDGFDIALRRRRTGSGDVVELVVNGMFAMDSHDTTSEIALADLVPPDAAGVLVGGLGLGYTADRLVHRLPGARVDVVELSAALVGWAREGLTDVLARVAAASGVTITRADIADVLAGRRQPPGPWDAILLDVDNGPDFLIHEHNGLLYGADLLARACDRLTPGGLLAVWSERESADLASRMAVLGAASGVRTVAVERDGHRVDYAIHWLRR
ncbi:MAG TPA: hypothetical protein VHO26_05420 [Propionibacteriaceae bacterium]|nr:hypothetical protein [Propionibacteriaceae bacterium]